MSRQIDVHMPHDGGHQYDELDDDPKCAFQPARHPNACERPSSQHERYLINVRVAGPPTQLRLDVDHAVDRRRSGRADVRG